MFCFVWMVFLFVYLFFVCLVFWVVFFCVCVCGGGKFFVIFSPMIGTMNTENFLGVYF